MAKHSVTRIPLKALIPGILVVLIVLVGIFAPLICPHDPYAQDLSQALQAPNAQHLLGTDRYGRDMLSRILMGTQTSLASALALVCIVAVLGTIIGILCGWTGGKLDSILMRVGDVFLAFPGLVFALAVAAVIGGGMVGAVLALSVIGWPKYARLARSLTLAQKNEDYVDAARVSGCNPALIMTRHLLPNIVGPLLVTAMLDIGTYMMELAGLSFLGLGAQPPTAEWGSMMSDNRTFLQIAPWTVFGPGLAIFVCVLSFNLLGDAIRDRFDPLSPKEEQSLLGGDKENYKSTNDKRAAQETVSS